MHKIMDVDILNLFDDSIQEMREVVPLEAVYALLDKQREEFKESMKQVCDEIKLGIEDVKVKIEVEEVIYNA